MEWLHDRYPPLSAGNAGASQFYCAFTVGGFRFTTINGIVDLRRQFFTGKPCSSKTHNSLASLCDFGPVLMLSRKLAC